MHGAGRQTPQGSTAAPLLRGAGPLDGALPHRPRLLPFLAGKHVANETLIPTPPNWRYGSEPVEGGVTVPGVISMLGFLVSMSVLPPYMSVRHH
mgnify:CR=1 FL=1